MAHLFIDTGAWVGIVDPRDQRHPASRAYFREAAREELVTSNYVLQETVTLLTYRGLRREIATFRELIGAAQSTNRLAVIWVDSVLHDAAWQVYDQFDDQEFSFVDCSSIALCRAFDIYSVFGFDRHFTIAGLTTVPGT